jgi:putative DNA primase/helicase
MPQSNIICPTYDYTDEGGGVLYQVVRHDPKDFRQRRPDGSGGWIWSLGEARRVLYRLPELLQYPNGTVFVTEGEKDADRVKSLGHCATTVASGKWTDDCVKALAGRHVIILQDNDDAGAKKALAAAQALHGLAKTIRIVPLPDLPAGGDVSDWLDADPKRASKLGDVCFSVPEWTPAATESEETAPARAPRLLSSAEFVRDFVPPDKRGKTNYSAVAGSALM